MNSQTELTQKPEVIFEDAYIPNSLNLGHMPVRAFVKALNHPSEDVSGSPRWALTSPVLEYEEDSEGLVVKFETTNTRYIKEGYVNGVPEIADQEETG